MSYNENFKGMLALTYYKQSANMSKYSENINLSKQSRYSKGALGYSQQGTGPELSMEGRKEMLHKHGLM